ncbi:hypothetical protein NOR_00406 [Metarhizium rileyi]|uniref:Heat-labile enterotoxin IIA, A chain n=1 Tax=Metarhizium rileyi (strain RCEF 4871) TaxID=1649241 RepID=A0A167KJK2_METRR|nr:hypothetical protein NOR_00406 [Metarhizium rileyi RCEF 4871]
MKITTFLTASTLASISLAVLQGLPKGTEGSQPGQDMCDAACRGIPNWGLNKDLQPPKSPNSPLRKMPLGLGMPTSPQKGNTGAAVRTGVTRIPGQPLGPKKKCRPCPRKRQLLCCGTFGFNPKASGSRARLTVAGKAAAFAFLVPVVQDLFEAIKNWDNPVGKSVLWFDNAIASVQEMIGGPSRSDIYGNDLKARLLCALKGWVATPAVSGRKDKLCTPAADEFKEELDRDFAKGKLDQVIEMCHMVKKSFLEDPWIERYCAALYRTDEYAQRLWEIGIEQLLDSCSEYDTNPPKSVDLRRDLGARCNQFRARISDLPEDTEKRPEDTEKSPQGQTSEIPPRKKKSDGDIRTTAHRVKGRVVCKVCGLTWSPDNGTCQDKSTGAVAWPVSSPDLLIAVDSDELACTDSTGEIPCGGGQTQTELDAGFAVCQTCGYLWEPQSGKCSSRTGEVIWPVEL